MSSWHLLMVLVVFSLTTLTQQTTPRLSSVVLPINYDLILKLTEEPISAKTFTGEITITIRITEDIIEGDNTTFQFHAKNLDYLKDTEASLLNNGVPMNVIFSQPDPTTELVTVTPSEPLPAGEKYSIHIQYQGILNDKDMTGFYKSSYLNSVNKERYVFATQFEEIHARKVFPCFDEPQMKATMDLQVCYPNEYHLLGYRSGADPSPEGDLQCVKITKGLGTTFKFSTYQFSFLVTPFWVTIGEPLEKLTIQVSSQAWPVLDDSSNLALESARTLLVFMENLTGLTYYSNISNIFTMAGIPDFAAGAMENVGLLMFREEYILWNVNESSSYNKQKVITILAHEISHQWFGNYVTMKWWNEMYLKEGFATYFEYYAADAVDSDMELPKQFVLEQLQSALYQDSLQSLPLSYDNDDPDYQNRINDVSYNKGASILRMLSYFMGVENFYGGLKDYIANNPYGSVTSKDLWAALQPKTNLDNDLSTIMKSWISKSHYPLVTAKLDGSKVTLKQEPFNIINVTDNTEWYIPITYSTKTSDFSNTTTKAWLNPKADLTVDLEDAEFFVLNNQAVGFYRVDYDDKLLDKISAALEKNVDAIDEISRSQLIDDQFNFAKTGRKSYVQVFNFLKFLKKDISYYTWYTVLKNFDSLLMATSNTKTQEVLKGFLQEHIEYFLKATLTNVKAIPPTHMYSLQQNLAWKWASRLEVEEYTAVLTGVFEKFMNASNEKPIPNWRNAVYCTALKSQSYQSTGFLFLWKQYLASRVASEKVNILESLGCSSNSALKRQHLMYSLTKDVKLQDAKYVFSSVYSNDDGVRVTLNFIIDSTADIINRLGESTLISLIGDVAQRFTTENELSRLQKFSEKDDLSEKVKTAIARALKTATENLQFTATLENEMEKFSSGALSNKCVSLMLIFVLFITKLR